MRIISQDGIYDLPYDKCTIWVERNEIIVIPIGEPDSSYPMAIYSTQEKAEKAMQLLHEAYSGMPIILQNVKTIEQGKIREMGNILKDFVCVNVPNEPSKFQCINKTVFRFPKEENL